MRLKDQQIIKQIIEKIRCTNDSLTVTTSQVQEAVNLCNFPRKPLQFSSVAKNHFALDSSNYIKKKRDVFFLKSLYRNM